MWLHSTFYGKLAARLLVLFILYPIRLVVHHLLQLVCESHLQFFNVRLGTRATPQRGRVAGLAATLLTTSATPPFEWLQTRVKARLANDTSMRCNGVAGFADVVYAEDPAEVPIETPPLIGGDHSRRLDEFVESVEEPYWDAILVAQRDLHDRLETANQRDELSNGEIPNILEAPHGRELQDRGPIVNGTTRPMTV